MVTFNLSDLSFILTQIKIAEAHSAGTPLTELVTNPLLPFGLRTVDGTLNNLIPGREDWGSADQPFLRLVPADRDIGTPDAGFDTNGPGPGTGQTAIPGNYADPVGNVVDTAPRTISNLIVDQTPNNPAAIYAALDFIGITGSAARIIVDGVAPLTAADRAAHHLEAAYVGAFAATGAGIVTTTNAQAAIDALLAAIQDDVLNDDGIVDAGDIAAAAAAVSAANRAVSSAQSTVTALQYDAGVVPADLAAAQLALLNAQAVAGQVSTLSGLLIIGSTIDPSDIADATTASGNAALNIGEVTTLNGSLVGPRDAAVAAANAATAVVKSYLLTATNNELVFNDNGTLSIPNVAPDEGISAPFNSWMTLFGQFFDHGLDLVEKTATTKVYVPLQPDDPLYVPGGNSNFMVITRTIENARNLTTPFVDQNQTYTSHASHQVFLREYTAVADDTHRDAQGNTDANASPDIVATGHLLEGSTGGLATWLDVKAQAADALGIRLSDEHIGKVPLLATDLYGEFQRGPNGFAQVVVKVTDGAGNSRMILVEGQNSDNNDALSGLDIRSIELDDASAAQLALLIAPPSAQNGNSPALDGNTATYTFAVEFTGHAFLDDIAHAANPYNSNGGNRTADSNGTAGDHFSQLGDDGRDMGNNQAFGGSVNYDNELLDAHFITGDGRGNENIGLTTVHHVFHSEHNRLAEHTKDVVLADAIAQFNAATTLAEQDAAIAFLNEWLDIDVTVGTFSNATVKTDLTWDGERVFQAARFGTEMQYQHLVFEEFARKVNPMVDLFIFNPTIDINPAIVAEFAHTVYRFGHSMLTETIDRLGADGQTTDDIGLIEAFLNPVEFTQDGTVTADEMAGAIVRGMTRQQGNEIDEFVTEALRNNLLGLPLDLPTVNLARGRETGVPSLQEARAAFYDEARSEWLKPYTSWVDFAQHLKNPSSIVNFIAAYGTHESIVNATTTAGKREAATLLVFGDGNNADGVTINGNTYTNEERLAFLGGSDAYTGGVAAGGTLGGLNDVDLWIGGLAEAILPFGGMLGSTFTFVFEKQMENLQNGDRFYYLSRTQGTHFVQELENNAFSKLIMLNTDLGQGVDVGLGPDDMGRTHLPGEIFSTPQYIIEWHQQLQNVADPTHDDPFLEALEPKVARDLHLNIDGNTYDRSIKFTGGEHVVLGGTEKDDVLIADLGDDTIWGDGGDDYIEGGHGINRLHGGTGSDIIYGGGDPEFIHGDEGDDIINGGNGLGDLIFGGSGNDFVVAGIDAKEVFAAEGNDFILGTPDMDFLLGGEGDDWIEAGEGFDTVAGENSELFFNSPIIGHDVMFSGTNESDFDAESGDDIMVQGESVMRSEGMFGFDWVSYEEHLSFGIDMDLRQKIITTAAADILRNRFDRVESVSGSKFGDILTGDDRTAPIGALDPTVPVNEAGLDGDGLDKAGVKRVDGLQEVLGLSDADLAGNQSDIVYQSGNVLVGGDGSDVLAGRGGNDFIDGDKVLNVRIGINDLNGNEVGTAEKMQGAVHFYTPAEVAALGDGYAVASPALVAREGQPLDTLVFHRAVSPGQLEIVREILDSSSQAGNSSVGGHIGDLDIAVFRGGLAEYRFTYTNDLNQVIVINGSDVGALAALTGIGDRRITIEHVGATPAIDDGVDVVENIERLEFADGSIDLVGGLNDAPVGTVTVHALINSSGEPVFQAGLPMRIATDSTGALVVSGTSATRVTDANNVSSTNPDGAIRNFTVTWQVETAPDSGVYEDVLRADGTLVTGPIFTPDPVLLFDGEHVRAVITYIDGAGIREKIVSGVTGPLDPATNLAFTGGDDTVVGYHDIPNSPANQGFGIVLPIIGHDGTIAAPIGAGAGDDIVRGLSGDDFLSGGAAGEGNELLFGGAGTDTAVFIGNSTDYVLELNAEGVLEVVHNGAAEEDAVFPDVEFIHFTGDNVTLSVASIVAGVTVIGSPNTDTFAAPTGPAVAGTITGSDFADRIFGAGGDDVIDGGGSGDLLGGGAGDDTIAGGGGNDIIGGGTGANTIVAGREDDTFLVGINENGASDTIRDRGGIDRIDVGRIVTAAPLAPAVLTTVGTVSILNQAPVALGALDASDDGLGNLVLDINGKTVTIEGHFDDPDAAVEVIDFNNSTFAGFAFGTNDYAVATTTSAAAGVNTLIAGTAGDETLNGNTGNDLLFGGDGVDRLDGGAGADLTVGGAGNDTHVVDVAGDRTVEAGGGGTDTVESATISLNLTQAARANFENITLTGNLNLDATGNGGTNVIAGNAGNNIISGGGGADAINAGDGNDSINYAIGDGADTIDGGAQTTLDTLAITAGGGNQTLDVVFDGTAITNFEGGTVTGIESVTADLGGGTDTLNYGATTAGVTVNLQTGTATGFTSIAGIENVTGGAGAELADGLERQCRQRLLRQRRQRHNRRSVGHGYGCLRRSRDELRLWRHERAAHGHRPDRRRGHRYADEHRAARLRR